nr:vitamin K epoxide reductase family protein [Muribaculaceae bacterium]
SRSMSLADFEKDATGVVLLAKAGKESREPDYTRHLFFESVSKGKTLLLVLSVVFLFAAGFAMSGLWRQLSSVLLTVVDIAGIAVTWLLILKTLKIKSKSADRICGVLQEHGCDHVLEQKASTFFGIFSWSEVGITYFTVSTLILILFPGEIHNLALINGCCLPFTVWSIWYQKFRIRTWCTLCVTTQCLLWLQFFCYFFGGWWKGIFPLRLPFFMIVAAYAAALLATNRLMNFIKNRNGSV